MKLICERNDNIIVEAVAEGSGPGKAYFIQGVFLQANLQNRNGRVYPLDILEKEVARYNQAYVSQNRALGELGHPDGPTINMERTSHLIKELYREGNNFIGKAKILDTPYGKIVKALIDEGVKVGVSSRGMGSLKETSGGVQEVQDDFYLATAADIVADPSAPAAFVQGIMENKEWAFIDGILTEQKLDQVRKTVKTASRKQIEETMLKEFSKLLRIF
jgi:hypothetical protein